MTRGTRGRRPRDVGGDAGEEVVLPTGDRHEGHGRLEVLGRPDPRLHLARHPEPRAVRVDLGGVRQERGVAGLERSAASTRVITARSGRDQFSSHSA